MIDSRATTATLFAAALLAFLLPFGTVSCGTPVTFTGLELATATVPDQDTDLVAEVESDGAFLAAVAGLSAIVGTCLALAGRRGQGWAALVGLLALTLLPWLAWGQWSVEVRAHSGYALAAGSLAAVVAIRASLLMRERRVAGHVIWPAVVGLCLLALLVGPTAVLLLEASRQALPAG